MSGVQLGARFSLAPNRLQYCGPDGADRVLYRAITDGAGVDAARRALERFEALVPYLEAIAEKHRLDPFDERVVEAYWLGNDLLDSFERRDFERLLDRLVRRGLPRSLAARLREFLPDHPLPHHVFHVGFVGVGNVTGHVPTTLANMEACRPAWGEVTAVGPDVVSVAVPALGLDDGQLRLGPPRPQQLPLDPRLVPGVQRGDSVALHWRTVVLRLDPDRLARLRRYTERSIAAANEALPRLGTFSGAPRSAPP